MYRLAGARINPKTNGPHRASGLPGTGITSIVLKKIDGGAETAVTMPPQARVSHVKFSPDGSRIAFLQTKDTGIELWVADAATGSAKAIVSGAERTVPAGPNVSENYGKAAPAPTFEDLLKTAHDDALFEYYFTSQLTAINA